MTHDYKIFWDESGSSLVSRTHFPCEYVVTSKTGDIERGIAQAAGFRVIELNDEGRIVEPLSSYLKDEPDAFSPKWKPLAEKIRSEFHPAPPSEAKGSGTAPTPVSASKPVAPDYGEVRFISGVAPGTVTETFEDGQTLTSSMGRRGRIETPPVQPATRTFNPFSVDMDGYMELRRQGFTPEVRVKVVGNDSLGQSADTPAWQKPHSTALKPHEMETWLEARARGEVPV